MKKNNKKNKNKNNNNNNDNNNKNNNKAAEVRERQEPHAWLHDPKANRRMAVIVESWLPKAT